MLQLEYAHQFNHTAERVWSVVGDFGHPKLGEGFVDRVETVGTGIGMERIFYLPDILGGGSVRERLDHYDPRLMTYGYSITDNGPLPWTGYEGVITIIPSGPVKSSLQVVIKLHPVTASAEECKAISVSNMKKLFENIEQILAV